MRVGPKSPCSNILCMLGLAVGGSAPFFLRLLTPGTPDPVETELYNHLLKHELDGLLIAQN